MNGGSKIEEEKEIEEREKKGLAIEKIKDRSFCSGNGICLFDESRKQKLKARKSKGGSLVGSCKEEKGYEEKVGKKLAFTEGKR